MITTTLHQPHTDPESTEDGAEARMRQALGKLGTAKPEAPYRANTYQAKPGAGRHRFKQDGEVPVVRLTLAEGARGGERQLHVSAANAGAEHGRAGGGWDQGHGETARQVQELTDQLRTVQTRLGHAELALRETGRGAQDRQEEAAGLRQALDAAEGTLAQLRVELAASERTREELERSRHVRSNAGLEAEAQGSTPVRRKAGRPLGSINRARGQKPDRKPKPVKWWAGD